MDDSLYIGFSGVNRVMRAQQVHANNLANLNTRGFRKDFVISMAVPITDQAQASRVMTKATGTSSAMGSGPVIHTGRDLDIAVSDEGWISVVDDNGQEAYTRAGHLRLDAEGRLVTRKGRFVASLGGAIEIPPYRHIDISGDGTINIVPAEGATAQPVAVGQIKLVNPDPRDITKGSDGLFRRIDGTEADKDAKVQLKSGFLEASNVNAVEEMVQFMNLARQFEFQLKVMKTAETLAASGDRLIRIE